MTLQDRFPIKLRMIGIPAQFIFSITELHLTGRLVWGNWNQVWHYFVVVFSFWLATFQFPVLPRIPHITDPINKHCSCWFPQTSRRVSLRRGQRRSLLTLFQKLGAREFSISQPIMIWNLFAKSALPTAWNSSSWRRKDNALWWLDNKEEGDNNFPEATLTRG